MFRNLNITLDSARVRFGRTRPRLAAELNGAITFSRYCPAATTSGCATNPDGLIIDPQPDAPYGEQVWGAAGVWVQAHEYGHAYHEKALGGFVRYWAAQSCPPHGLSRPTPSLECALPEGFADYFAVATRGTDTGYEYAFEQNTYYINNIVPFYGAAEGPRSEAAVGAFLYDITDVSKWGAEAWDRVAASGSYVADVISGCQVFQGGQWIRNTGVDHLVYCFERTVDSLVVNNHFATRSPKPTAQNISFGTPAQSDIRALWRRNLYNQ